MTRPARSFLYVPGDRPDRVTKAFASTADAVIIDLEDAVKPENKSLARDTVRAVAAQRTGLSELWVRINSGAEGVLDLRALRGCFGTRGSVGADAIDGVVLAKCDSVDWLDTVAEVVRADVVLAPLIETARGVRALDSIVGHPRVSRCHLGEVDLLAELGGRLPGGSSLVEAARVELVMASAAAAIEPPVGGVHLAIDDLAALTDSSGTLADLGFGGRAVIHPTHCTPVNRAFSPSASEIAWAADVLARLAGSSSGAVRAADGSMLDEAIARRARRIVATTD
jgi:citrate lyase subunit beta / citryl-CoA lyase